MPFGEEAGDIAGPSVDDGTMMIPRLDVPITFFQEKEYRIYVSIS